MFVIIGIMGEIRMWGFGGEGGKFVGGVEGGVWDGGMVVMRLWVKVCFYFKK